MDAHKYIDLLKPRFRYGNIFPPSGAGVRRGSTYEFYRLVPLDVMEISVGLGIKDYTPEGVEEAIGNFWRCVDLLAAEKVDRIILGGVPISSQLGRERVRSLLGQVKERHGIEADAPLESIIAGLEHLGARKVAIGSRWADQLNEAMCRYLKEAGIEVLGVTSRGQWAGQAFGMSFEEGLQTVIEVGREAAQMAPQADALIVPGGAAMNLHVIPALEDEFGKPVLTNLNSEIWHGLIHPGVIDPLKNWGRLLASR